MSSETNHPWQVFSSPTVSGRREALVERFQASWRGGVRPDLADLVSQAEETERDAVLKDLVRLDAQSRRDLGESPQAADYLPAFPACKTQIEEALSSSHDSTSPSDKLGTRPPGSVAEDEPAGSTPGQSSLPASPSIPPPPRWREPTVVAVGNEFGPYELLAQLGQGGIGTVYKARHRHLDKLVCIKVLRPQYTHEPESILRFQREMKAVGRITHPHIVQAFDAGAIDGVHFLAMEYIEGVTLSQRVYDKGRMTVADACKVISQSAQALSAAHLAGLVHRDVKPSNLFVTKTGHIKLLDLGLAKLCEDTTNNPEFTAVGQAFGTPDYMAPEQWSDARLADARADLYALGCTLFFVLTGRAPFSDDSLSYPTSKRVAHSTAAIPDLKALRPDVPAGVDAIYRKLMAKSPQKRYQSAEELLKALAPFTPDGPISDDAVPEVRKPVENPGQLLARERTYRVLGLASLTIALIAIGGWLLFNLPNSGINKSDTNSETATKTGDGKDSVEAEIGTGAPVTQVDLEVSNPVSALDVVRQFAPVTVATEPNTPADDQISMADDAVDKVPIEPIIAGEPPWEVGPEPPWLRGSAHYSLKNDPVLLGIVERPRVIPGIKRWNVETVYPRTTAKDIEWSPDGKWIATAGNDGHVRIYEAASLTLSLLIPGAGAALDLSWHPKSENLAIIADSGQAVRVVQLDGRILWESALRGTGHCVVWNRAGDHLAIGMMPPPDKKPIVIVADKTWEVVKSLGKPGEAATEPLSNASIAWGLDDRSLIAVHADRTVRSWDLTKDDDKFKTVGEFKGPNQLTIDLNQDGWLVVSDRDCVRIYDSHLKFYREDVWGHRHAKWRPGSRQVLRSSEVVSLWEPNAAPEDDQFIHSDEVFDRIEAAPWCWSPAGDRCINADNFYMLDSSLDEQQPPVTGLTKGIVEPYWSPDGKMFLTSHDATENALRIWQADGKQLMAWDGPSFDSYHAERFAWHPESSELLVADSRKFYSLHIAQRSTTDYDIGKKQIASAAWSLDGEFALAGMADGSVHVFERSGVSVKTLSRGNASKISVASPERPSRWEPFGLWKKLSVPDADGTSVRETWARTWIGPAWQPQGHQLLLGGTEITSLDRRDLHRLWHAVALPAGRAVTLSAAGELMDGAANDVDHYLVYYVERDDERIEALTPARFRELVASPGLSRD